MESDIDAQIEQRIFGHTVVGLVRAWDPSGEGYSIMRPNEREHLGELRPAWVSHCTCDIMPRHQDSSKWDCSIVSRASHERLAAEDRAEYEADRAVWGHSSHCLDVVPWYSSDISAAWRIVVHLHERFDLTLDWSRDKPSAAFIPVGYDYDPTEYCAEGETVPLAICLAALKTVE